MNALGVIMTIIGTILTIYNTASARKWKIKNYEYQKQMDKYKTKLEESNQKYNRKINDKKEIINFINKFVELEYSTIMSSISFLYALRYAILKLRNDFEHLESSQLESFLKEHYEIKKDLMILKTDTNHLYMHFNDDVEFSLIGGTFNEIYFLNEFVEIQIMKHYNREKLNNKVIIEDIDKALISSQQVLDCVNQLNNLIVNKLQNLYSDKTGTGEISFVSGTEYFSWYFPKHPYKVRKLKFEN